MNQLNYLIYYFNEGGLLMWPLLLCSIVAVAVIIERAVRLRRAALIDPAVVESIQTQIEEGKLDLAIAANRNSPTLVGRILSRALEEYANTSTDIETALTEAASRGLPVLQNNLAVLNLVARVAPLLGLLGTVQGMILGFEHLELQGVGKENLAHAIRVALITTFAGLAIAIPTVVAAAYFRSRIRRLTAEFEEIFIDVIKSVKSARPPRAPLPEPKAEIAGRNNA
jgi:biopolymer transport protein ExbB